MRELSVIGAKIDINRGLPIVHVNFLGYDEQSHRRGPHSRFAHWTLKGIDDAIKRLWRAADRSLWRHYDVWIYSDHGQVTSLPYQQQQGQTIDEAVAAAFRTLSEQDGQTRQEHLDSIQTQRVRFLGGVKFQRAALNFSGFSKYSVSIQREQVKSNLPSHPSGRWVLSIRPANSTTMNAGLSPANLRVHTRFRWSSLKKGRSSYKHGPTQVNSGCRNKSPRYSVKNTRFSTRSGMTCSDSASITVPVKWFYLAGARA
jgi:hypothetical protein